MASKLYYHDFDLVKNRILNFKLHPLTTSERNTLGSTLNSGDEGITVFDTTLDQIFSWSGTQWKSIDLSQYALDSSVVHRTGSLSENITGIKSFNSKIVGTIDNSLQWNEQTGDLSIVNNSIVPPFLVGFNNTSSQWEAYNSNILINTSSTLQTKSGALTLDSTNRFAPVLTIRRTSGAGYTIDNDGTIYSVGAFIDGTGLTNQGPSTLNGTVTINSPLTIIGHTIIHGGQVTGFGLSTDEWHYDVDGNYEIKSNLQHIFEDSLATSSTPEIIYGGITGPHGIDQVRVSASSFAMQSDLIEVSSYSELKNLISQIAEWGDSLTNGTGSTGGHTYPQNLQDNTGYTSYNMGIGGETSTQIKVRMLADTAKTQYNVIIWAGRNNYTDTATVLSDIAAMVSSLGHNRYLVLGVLNGDFAGESIGGSGYNYIVDLNAQLSTIYGSHYVPIREYLVSKYNTALSQDVIDHGNDIVPTSLRSDQIHLNNTGYAYVADYIKTFFSTLTQTPTDKILSPTGLVGALSAPPVIGNKIASDIYSKNLFVNGSVNGPSNNLSVSNDLTVIGQTYLGTTTNTGNFLMQNYDQFFQADGHGIFFAGGPNLYSSSAGLKLDIPTSNKDFTVTTTGNGIIRTNIGVAAGDYITLTNTGGKFIMPGGGYMTGVHGTLDILAVDRTDIGYPNNDINLTPSGTGIVKVNSNLTANSLTTAFLASSSGIQAIGAVYLNSGFSNFIANFSGDIITLATGGSERLRVDGSGNLFLGFTADPASGNKLAINGNTLVSGTLVASGFTLDLQPFIQQTAGVLQYRPYSSNGTTWSNYAFTNTNMSLDDSGNLTVKGNIIKNGGTSSQVLLADGSVGTYTSVIKGNSTTTGTATTDVVVTIGSTMANTTYTVSITPRDLLTAVNYYISAQTTTTFTITFVTALTGSINFDWTLNP